MRRQPQLGAHTSIAGGLHLALARGAALGCDVIQLFTKSNQQWAARAIDRSELELWRRARTEHRVEPALAHVSYLINPAAAAPRVAARSRTALAQEVARCALLGIPMLVLHPGSHMGEGESRGVRRCAAMLNDVLDAQPDERTRVLLENTAGQGSALGYRFEHLRDILGALRRPERAGICLDTCHALAAGYDLASTSGWEQTLVHLEATVGRGTVRALHLNDSKKPRGARIDRHAHIGHGYLDLAGFRRIVNTPSFAGLPMVIETPKEEERADAVNLAVLRALVGCERVSARVRQLAAQLI